MDNEMDEECKPYQNVPWKLIVRYLKKDNGTYDGNIIVMPMDIGRGLMSSSTTGFEGVSFSDMLYAVFIQLNASKQYTKVIFQSIEKVSEVELDQGSIDLIRLNYGGVDKIIFEKDETAIKKTIKSLYGSMKTYLEMENEHV